jgi:hypothetical protein
VSNHGEVEAGEPPTASLSDAHGMKTGRSCRLDAGNTAEFPGIRIHGINKGHSC